MVVFRLPIRKKHVTFSLRQDKSENISSHKNQALLESLFQHSSEVCIYTLL